MDLFDYLASNVESAVLTTSSLKHQLSNVDGISKEKVDRDALHDISLNEDSDNDEEQISNLGFCLIDTSRMSGNEKFMSEAISTTMLDRSKIVFTGIPVRWRSKVKRQSNRSMISKETDRLC